MVSIPKLFQLGPCLWLMPSIITAFYHRSPSHPPLLQPSAPFLFIAQPAFHNNKCSRRSDEAKLDLPLCHLPQHGIGELIAHADRQATGTLKGPCAVPDIVLVQKRAVKHSGDGARHRGFA
ncbi:hypothetical protein ABZP36_000681 [Zizania latifolia]